MTLLEVTDLTTYYETEDGAVHATDGVSFTLEAGSTLGLVGESGSGKTTIAKSLLRLLPDNGRIVEGEVNYKGRDIAQLPMRQFKREIRWSEVTYIPQNAMNGFDPVYTVGEQIVQVIRAHEDASKSEARERAEELLERVGIEPGRIDDYPHQLSGGMAQRAMIALALALEPSLIIADEPTTALDVVIQDRILNSIKDVQEEIGSAMILITHDMSVVSETCDEIGVVYGGRIVEHADARTVIKNPRHPYTLGLRNAFPSITSDDQELVSIPGAPPELVEPAVGCRFEPRCPFAESDCRESTPPPEEVADGHTVECLRADEYEHIQDEAGEKSTWRAGRESPRSRTDD